MATTSNVVWRPRIHYTTFARELVEDQGFHFAGDGAFACVFVNPVTKRAIKIGKQQDSYILFARAVYELQQKRRQRNPFFPRIYNITLRSQWYMIEMEVLTPIKGTDQYKEAQALMDCLERVLVGGPCPKNIADYVSKFSAHVWEAAAIIGIARNEVSRNPGVDLHDCNVMLRGKQLVITDPLDSQVLVEEWELLL